MPYKTLLDITKRQEQIVDLVFKFRYINRHQIQKILNHKDPKRINAWLKDLVEKGYLGRIYSHKLLENTKPAIYYLNNNGILFIKNTKGGEYGNHEELEQKYIKKFYQDKSASEIFINHSISICQLYIQLKELEKTKENSEYCIQTKTEMWIEKQIENEKEDFTTIKEYIPDLHIEEFTNPENENIHSSVFFFTLFDAHVPRYAIRYKIDQYIKLHDEGNWRHVYAGLDDNFPVMFFILSDQRKVNSIRRYIRKQFEETFLDVEGMVFMLTTQEAALKTGVAENIWKTVKVEV